MLSSSCLRKPAVDFQQVSLVIVHYGQEEFLIHLLDSLESHPDAVIIDELIVVNNQEQSLSPEAFRWLSGWARRYWVLGSAGGGYAAAVNRGVAAATGDILLISNNDIQWRPDSSVRALFPHFRDPAVGVVGPQLMYPDGSWQRSYGSFPSPLTALASCLFLDTMRHIVASFFFQRGLWQRARVVDYVDGAFMAVRRTCFEEVGGFDEEFTFYGEEVDFCFRASRRGWKVLWEPGARIVHLRGATSARVDAGAYARRLLEAQCRFINKHYGARPERRYRRLIRWAMAERAVMYRWIARLHPSPQWQARAEEARLRYEAIL